MDLKVDIDREEKCAYFAISREDGVRFMGEYDVKNIAAHMKCPSAFIRDDNFLDIIEKFAVLGNNSCVIQETANEIRVTLNVTARLVSDPPITGKETILDSIDICCQRVDDDEISVMIRELRDHIVEINERIEELESLREERK